jgi:hypothetical protein
VRQKTLIVLAVITVPTALAAAFVPKPSTSVEKTAEGGPVLPGLKAGIDSATTLVVTGPEGVVTLARKPVAGKIDQGWTLPDKGGYPADPAKVKPVLDALIALHGVEPRTDRPKLYSRLDLGEPGKGSGAHLVAISDASNKQVATIVIGKQKFGAEGDNDSGVYVRKPGDAQTWFARPAMTLPADAFGWIDHAILNIEADKIKDVVLTPAGSPPLDLTRAKAGDKLAVKELPKDAKLKSDDPGADIASSFNLELDDVKPAAQVTGTPAGSVHVTTLDGLTADLTLTKQGDKTWITVTASGTGDAAKAADPITARTKGWAYAIPDATAATLESKLADLEEAPPAKPEAAEAPPPAIKPPKKK